MKKWLSIIIVCIQVSSVFSQNILTPESLWSLKKVEPIGLTKDKKFLIYKVNSANIEGNKSEGKYVKVSIDGLNSEEILFSPELVNDKNVSPNGNYLLYSDEVKLENVWGNDFYPELIKSNVQIYNSLNYRHWDTWNEGKYNHPFFKDITNPNDKGTDILPNATFDCPQKPFGGDEDFIWSPDSKKILYVTKKTSGTEYAKNTNSDIYEYDIETKTTKNITEGNKGYDQNPVFSPQGELSWLQMKRNGYESDKNDIIIILNGQKRNMTAHWDETVSSFSWNNDGSKIFFIAPVSGTQQLFSLDVDRNSTLSPKIVQITEGNFDINSIIAIEGNSILVTRCNMHTANEIFSYNYSNKTWNQLTHLNDNFYKTISPSTSEKRWVPTKDGKKMLVWVVYPPNFDKTKKYPTLLYCQGGPQSALTQFHSFRWNLGLIASQGYIVVAPNRRGMPGHGIKWNEDISKDWGGKAIDDYLVAIDDVSKESYVDKTRRGAVGASYGGYSVFYLAGVHKNRFKSLISHCGIFDLESMYGTTEEVFFSDWDMGGSYWDKNNAAAQKTYNQFNPIKLVNNWNTPILIFQGAKDYRVPMGQAQEAFQAAQLKGIKSRFILFNDENHWITKPQNSLVWQREFFKWLKETL